MIIECKVKMDDALAKRIMEAEKCTEEVFKSRVQMFGDQLINQFFKDIYKGVNNEMAT